MCYDLALTKLPLQDIANILLQYKGDRGGNILRNIVGNKGGLGRGYCTIMCNNSPFSVSRTIFFQTPPPIQNPTTKANKNTSKHLQTPKKHLKIGRGGAITGNIVQYIAQ